jgi:hypothetical protein
MEIIAVIFMLAAGGAIAVFVLVAMNIARREQGGDNPQMGHGIPDRERVAASILFQLLLFGGTPPDQALRAVRRGTAGIDVANWAETFAGMATPTQRAWLLETAVQLLAAPGRPIPLQQYSGLLDLSFALGFQTDALAKLREQYGFDYVDHAKHARPREADRGGGSLPLFVREERDPRELLRVLGIEGQATRQEIISAYRRLAAQIHPDRFHADSKAASDATARFIEITRAYESLMAIYRD